MRDKLDIHILHCGESLSQIKQCSDSMPNANVWIVPGVLGKLGASRKFGFSLGRAPYVSFADPDDTWFGDAFVTCVEGLENNPECSFAFTFELVDGFLDPNRRTYEDVCETPFFHGVLVYRRALVEKTNPLMPDFQRCYETGYRSRLMLKFGPALLCPVIGRDWIMSPGQTHAHATDYDKAQSGHLFSHTARLMRRRRLVKCL